MSAQPVLPTYSMNRPNFPRLYESSLVGPLFRPWAELLLERAALGRGLRILDVACGTGIVSRLAYQRTNGAARIVGVDVSAPMLEVAREIEPNVDWREGNAAALPVAPDERFDRVLCQLGLQFFGDRAAAARELRRVLEPDGLLLAAVWRAAAEMPVYDTLQRVAERHLGAVNDERLGFGDAQALQTLLTDAGFRDVRVDTVSLVNRFEDGAGFVRMNSMALLGMSGVRVGDDERERLLEAIVTESLDATRSFFDDDTLICEMRSNLATAR